MGLQMLESQYLLSLNVNWHVVAWTAEKLANTTLPHPEQVIFWHVKTKILRLIACYTDPIMTFEALSSAPYQVANTCISFWRRYLFSVATTCLNSIGNKSQSLLVLASLQIIPHIYSFLRALSINSQMWYSMSPPRTFSRITILFLINS